MPRVEHSLPHVDRRVRGPAVRHRPFRRAPGRADERLPRAARVRPPTAPPSVDRTERGESPGWDRGLGLLIMFTAGVLVMVALIVLTGAIASWWMLAPVMAVDFAVTAAVLASIVRLLND